MKRLLYISLFFPLFSWANYSPIDVHLRETRSGAFGIKKVEVVSLVDHISIDNVRFNRGNCQVNDRQVKMAEEWYAYAKNACQRQTYTSSHDSSTGISEYQQCLDKVEKEAQEKIASANTIKTVSLKYGEKTSYEYSYSCDLREVEIQTNLGTWINNQFTPLESNDEEEGMEYICDGCDEEATIYQHFDNVGGKTVELLKFPAMGMSCPGGTFMFRDATSETETFGTCSETVDIRQKGDKIIVTMPGYQYASFGDGEDEIKASEDSAKEIWQFIYQNGNLETKQLR